jgi:hypothetical protein
MTIDDEIKRTYPVTKREKCCALYKAKMEAKRLALKNRLMNDRQGENRVCEAVCEHESQIRQDSLS